MTEGEIYKYSEVKKNGSEYIEYIYRNGYTDDYYEENGLPTGSFVCEMEIKREYNEYALITSYFECGMGGYYEYRLKDE